MHDEFLLKREDFTKVDGYSCIIFVGRQFFLNAKKNKTKKSKLNIYQHLHVLFENAKPSASFIAISIIYLAAVFIRCMAS